MPATFDLLMDTPTSYAKSVFFCERFEGIPVEHGWDAFLRRNVAEQKEVQARYNRECSME